MDLLNYINKMQKMYGDQASLADDLEPGALKDELLKDFDPSQETYEEYLQRKSLERPFNMAYGGRIGFEKGLKVEDLTPRELANAQKAARLRNISGKKSNQEFIDFVGGDEYKRFSTLEKEAAENLGMNVDKYKKLSFAKRKKLRTDLFNKKVKESSKFLRPEASVEEVIKTIYTNPKKISNFNKNTLNNYYRQWFREEYDNLVKSGEPFTRTEVSGRVIQRIKDTYTRDGVLPKEFLPGYTDNPGTKNYDEFFVPKNPKDKIFSNAELKKIKSVEGRALRVTKNNLRVFNALYDGINEVDDIAKMLNMPASEVRATVNTVMNGMTRTQLPYYLQDKIDDFGTVINNLAGSESLDDLWRRNTKTLIYQAFPEDSKSRNRAFKKIDEFEKYIKNIKKEFPGLQIAYDHPAGYAALKSQNINNFLNITPIANDINIFKGNFDTKSKNNLVAMDKALKNGDMDTYKSLLKNQRKLEKLWSNLTGGQSTLGKIRLGKVIDYGTRNILEDQKSFVDEFKNNIKIRENISKNLTDENIKIMNEVFPGGKYYKTKMLESAKKIISPDLVNRDKQINQDLLKLAGTVNPKCRKGAVDGGRIGFQDGLSPEFCINEGKKVARNLIAKNREGTLAQKSIMKRITSGVTNFAKSILDPKELFDIKKQFFSKGALASVPIFDAVMAADDALRKDMDPKEAFAKTLTFGTLPRALGFTDSIDVINAKKMLEDPSLSPAGKEYAQLIIDSGDYKKMQSDTTGGMTKKFTEFKKMQEKIKNASTAGRFDYEKLLTEKAATDKAGEYVGEPQKVGPGTYLAFDGEEVRKVNEFGYARKGTTFDAPDKPDVTPLINKLATPAKSRGPMTEKKKQKVDLTPTTYQNFKPNYGFTKEQFEDAMRKEGALADDQVYTDAFYRQEIEKPIEFEQLMELPSFRGASEKFAGGGIAGLSGGDPEGAMLTSMNPDSQGLRSLYNNGRKL